MSVRSRALAGKPAYEETIGSAPQELDLDKDLLAFDNHRIRTDGILRRQPTDLPGAHVETRTVCGALDILTVEEAIAQFDLVMTADVADREDLAAGQSDQADR
jgi:hypothetical protein